MRLQERNKMAAQLREKWERRMLVCYHLMDVW